MEDSGGRWMGQAVRATGTHVVCICWKAVQIDGRKCRMVDEQGTVRGEAEGYCGTTVSYTKNG